MGLTTGLLMPQFQRMTSEKGIVVRDWRLYFNDIESALISIPVSPSEGGTGVDNGSSTISIGGNLTFGGAFATTFTVTGTTNLTLPTSGTLVSTTSGAALTRVNDTNVTLVLGGSPATALVNAASLTLGWTGTLAVARGGIGVGTLALNGVLYGNAAGAVQALAVNATATNKFLTQSASGAPAWNVLVTGDLPAGTGTGSLVFATAPTLAKVVLQAGTAAAGTAPLKLTSGVNLTAAEAGALEFTTDDLYFTITTGAARKGLVLNNGANLTSGKYPIATTNGRLTDGPTPLAGVKVYYVSDTSGGPVTRKLTFTDGVLTSEV